MTKGKIIALVVSSLVMIACIVGIIYAKVQKVSAKPENEKSQIADLNEKLAKAQKEADSLRAELAKAAKIAAGMADMADKVKKLENQLQTKATPLSVVLVITQTVAVAAATPVAPAAATPPARKTLDRDVVKFIAEIDMKIAKTEYGLDVCKRVQREAFVAGNVYAQRQAEDDATINARNLARLQSKRAELIAMLQ